MKLLGLTGGIATGKSTVSTLLKRLGAKVIDADELAREVVRPGQEAWREIIDAFGPTVVTEEGSIDRKRLRKIIFHDPAARKRLESILHPRIRALARERIQALSAEGHEIIIYEAPLLFETQAHHWLRPVILVACDEMTQRKRLRERDGLSEKEIAEHLSAQMSLEDKRQLADFIIENSGDLKTLEKEVLALWEKIKAI